MDFHIIPECFVDTKLIKAIAPPTTKRGYNHQKGCLNVVKVMQEKLYDEFALGILDKDKKTLKYCEEFEPIFEIENSLTLLKHQNRHHYLIFICPAIEKWLIDCAEKANISLKDFGLPTHYIDLQKITKTAKSEEKDAYSSHLKQLFEALLQNKAKNVLVLAYWVNYLKKYNYNANLAEIRLTTTEILAI